MRRSATASGSLDARGASCAIVQCHINAVWESRAFLGGFSIRQRFWQQAVSKLRTSLPESSTAACVCAPHSMLGVDQDVATDATNIDDVRARVSSNLRPKDERRNDIEVCTTDPEAEHSSDNTENSLQRRQPPARTLMGMRPLSSECLEGLDTSNSVANDTRGSSCKIVRRGRSESEPRITEVRLQSTLVSSSPRDRSEFLEPSGAPSERQQQILDRQYSSEASSPPPQVLQGFKLDYVALDKRSWLEVRDKNHRYGKNLRLYFKEWDRRGKPGGSFFKWLSTPEVQLEGCPRDELENDVVHYCRPEERLKYALSLKVTDEGKVLLHTATGEPVDSGPEAWLFVLRDRIIFASDKKTDPPRFHHSSFFGGGYVEAAGMMTAKNGILTKLYPHSGHYRPTNLHLHRLLLFLRGLGVDLSAIDVDAQRVHKVARPEKNKGPRVRKMDNPLMVSGRYLLDFFETKHKAWQLHLFDDIVRKVEQRAHRLNDAGGGVAFDATKIVEGVSEDVKAVSKSSGQLNTRGPSCERARTGRNHDTTTSTAKHVDSKEVPFSSKTSDTESGVKEHLNAFEDGPEGERNGQYIPSLSSTMTARNMLLLLS